MFLVHFALVSLIFAIIMLPRVFAIHFSGDNSVSREEYDYR